MAFMKNINKNPYNIAAQLEQKSIPFAWVTLVDTTGVVTRTSGRMLVQKDGTAYGTVGGGEVEYKTILQAQNCLKKGKGGLFKIERDSEHSDGSSLTIAVDIGEQNNKLVIIGGGHVAQEVANIGSNCGFEINIIEKRAEYASEQLFPMATQIICTDSISTGITELEINEKTSILILNHGLMTTEDYKLALQTKAEYVGIMASHKHMYKFIGNLEVTAEENKKLHCPIGLKLSGQTPYQIAISIIAEVMSSHKRANCISSTDLYRPVIVRGAGDLATATILKLHNCGYPVIALEIEKPTVIRRTVSFAQAMYDGTIEVEGVVAKKIDKDNIDEIISSLDKKQIPIVSDKEGVLIKKLHPLIVIDAILAKKNYGTSIDDAPLVIALGPGFEAGKDCHYVVETQRGHYLGRIIDKGSAIANTGIPGLISGYGKERVIHSPAKGIWTSDRKIGDIVKKGDLIALVDDTKVYATIDGKIRGLLQNGLKVPVGFKVADIDPRGESTDHKTVTDKGRNIAGGVLEAILRHKNK